MKKLLFINGGKKKFASDFISACQKHDINVLPIRMAHTCFFIENGNVQVFVNNELLDVSSFDYGFFRVRGNYPHTSSIFLKLLQFCGIPHNDFSFSEHQNSIEKSSQMILLPLGGIPIPNTWLCNRRSLASNRQLLESKITFPCVLKVDGSQGSAVWKVHSFDEITSILLDQDQEICLIQEMVENSFDIRSLCIFGKVLGAIRRTSIDGFYNNVSKGGSATPIELTGEERALALRSCEVLRIDFGGVDIVRTDEGPKIFEVNAGPQIYGFESATNLTVSDHLVAGIIDQIS